VFAWGIQTNGKAAGFYRWGVWRKIRALTLRSWEASQRKMGVSEMWTGQYWDTPRPPLGYATPGIRTHHIRYLYRLFGPIQTLTLHSTLPWMLCQALFHFLCWPPDFQVVCRFLTMMLTFEHSYQTTPVTLGVVRHIIVIASLKWFPLTITLEKVTEHPFLSYRRLLGTLVFIGDNDTTKGAWSQHCRISSNKV